MSVTPAEADIRAFYAAALAGLRYIEEQRPTDRRFGPNADARWAAFHGDLETSDRIDLMIRDADAHWVGAFGARTVFGFGDVSEDDPFGAKWTPLGGVDAEDLWRGELERPVPASIAVALGNAAKAWGISVAPMAAPAVGAADKLVVAGPGAIVALAEAFAGGADLDWADQVVAVATPAAHRQLAAMVAGMLGATRACAIVAASEVAALDLKGRGLVVSEDAQAEDAAAAHGAVG
ncbi:MAG: hypothetical protein R3B72_37935 [Polyangiaceae bacterium]